MKNLLLISFLIISCTKISNEALKYVPLKDIDGNEYHSIIIGTQEWMVENLSVTRFNDGSDITLISNDITWKEATISGYCWYNNIEPIDKTIDGALYNFYAVNANKLCPINWHVPSDEEWKTFELFIGMSENDVDQQYWRGEGIGTLLKSQAGWCVSGGTQNQYGFNAMPSGSRDEYCGCFYGAGYDSNGDGYDDGGQTGWWTSTIYRKDVNAWTRLLCDETTIGRFTPTYKSGFSVRCIKNNK